MKTHGAIYWCKDDNRADKYLHSIKDRLSELYFKLNAKLSIDDLKLLNDESNRSLLREINESNVPKDEIHNLLKMVNELGSAQQLLEHGRKLLEERNNFNYLASIGNLVEHSLKDALLEVLPDMQISHVGIGAFDFVIKNPKNGKSYYIELKSYAMNSTRPFRLAPSQAQRASKDEDNYALCFLPRTQTMSGNEYIKANLKFKKNLSGILTSGLSDFNKFNEIMSRSGNASSWLYLAILEQVRIEAPKDIMINGAGSFQELINDIIKYLS